MYGWLMNTKLYGAYLKNRIWMWRNCARFPVLPVYIFFMHALIWFILPGTIVAVFVSLVAIFAVNQSSIGLFMDNTFFLVMFPFFIATAPITLRAGTEHLFHFIALLAATFGVPDRALKLHRLAQEEFAKWEQSRV